MGKHTPGPWSVCGDGDCSCMTVAAPDHPVAQVTSGKWGDEYAALRIVGESSLDQKVEAYTAMIEYGSVDAEAAKANALLIAAAPELLEAAKQMYPLLVDDDRPLADYDIALKWRAAIKKAEGK